MIAEATKLARLSSHGANELCISDAQVGCLCAVGSDTWDVEAFLKVSILELARGGNGQPEVKTMESYVASEMHVMKLLGHHKVVACKRFLFFVGISSVAILRVLQQIVH